MTQTWGLFLLGVLLAGLAALIVRERRLLSVPLMRQAGELDAGHLAYLSDGQPQAVAASLTFLHLSGTLEIEPGGRLRRTGEPTPTASTWDTDVLRAADGARADRVNGSPALAPGLRAIREDLIRWGYLVSPAIRSRSIRHTLLIGLLVLCGIPATISQITDTGPLWAFAGGALIIGLIILSITISGDGRITRRAKAALAELRRRHDHLRPHHRPAWQTYDPPTAALGVALFGDIVMWDCDPELARAAGIRRPGDNSHDSDGSGCGGDGGGCGD